MIKQDFKIKSYGVSELAMLYCPDLTPIGALCKFKRWLKLNKDLREKLGYQDGKRRIRSFTPSEVREIVNYLGEP